MSILSNEYKNSIAPALMTKFGYKSVMQIPKLEKVVINVGAGEAKENSKVIDAILRDLSLITGQKAIPCRAKKSVANFKLREGMPIGAKVTLRGERMYEFIERLFNAALPRVRDFRGINPNAFDGRGNYAMGVKEQLIFPEIEYDKIDKVRGMDIIFVTTAKTDEEARELLTLSRQDLLSFQQESITDAKSAAAHMLIFASTAFAVYASESLLIKARSPE